MAVLIPKFGEDITKSKCRILVNSVNCKGISGKGVALDFKKSHPENHKEYNAYCKHGHLHPGEIFYYFGDATDEGHLVICNAAVKDHWKPPSQLAWVRSCIVGLAEFMASSEAPAIAIPPLGCGLGGLSYEKVLADIVYCFRHLECEVHLYGGKEHERIFEEL